MKYNFKYLLGLVMALSFTNLVAQPTIRFDATKTHQRITGFGGFVCSPQFQYGHMSTADIKKVWGPESTEGCTAKRSATVFEAFMFSPSSMIPRR